MLTGRRFEPSDDDLLPNAGTALEAAAADTSGTSESGILPPADVLAKLPFQKDIGDDELKYSDRWTEVKSA